MAGGMGRPGASIGSGVGAGLPQFGGSPIQAQSNAQQSNFKTPNTSPTDMQSSANEYQRIVSLGRIETPQDQAYISQMQKNAMGQTIADPNADVSQYKSYLSNQMPLQNQQNAPMPIFNQPSMSPMQQYMQRMMPQQPMINRAQYDAGRYINDGSRGYAAWRAPQTFKPQLTPQQTAASAAAAKPQQSELDKLRAELEEMRSRQAGSNTNDGGGYR